MGEVAMEALEGMARHREAGHPLIALRDDLIQLDGWDADGHLRGVQVEPDPDDCDSEGEARLSADVEESVKGTPRVEVCALAADKVVNID